MTESAVGGNPMKRALIVGDVESPEGRMMASMGYIVDFANSPAEAQDRQADTQYDAVLWLPPHTNTTVRESEQQLWEDNRHLALLSDTASRLLVTDNPQGLVQSLCEKAMEVLDCQAFFNFLVDEEHDCLHLNAFAGIPDEAGKDIEWLDYGVAVCGCAAQDGCRIVAEDIFNTPDPRTDLVKSYGIQAYACHPLLAQGGRVIGTLSFGSVSRARFTSDELALMKAVADQVATAMERIRLLNVERQRAEELQAILDAVPVVVWIAHDPDARRITGSRISYELLRMPKDANASRTAPEDERPTHFTAMKDGKEIPLDELPVQMAARGRTIENYEFDVVFDDGTSRSLLGDAVPLFDQSGNPRGSVGAFRDITESKRTEAHKREFYRRTILAATEGKLLLCEPDEIAKAAGCELGSWQVSCLEGIRNMRDEIRRIAGDSGMEESRVHSFMGCTMEAIGNAYKHAGGGRVSLSATADGLLLAVSDSGPGIGAIELPDVALTKGYTTAGTLGMGYKIMIRFADRVYLSTGPDGTTVAIEMRMRRASAMPVEPQSPALAKTQKDTSPSPHR